MSSVVGGRRDQRASSETEIECDELQPMTEEEGTAGWRRLLKMPPQPMLAPVAPTFSLHDLAQKKDPGTDEQAAPSTLAGHVMWKLSMRMSSHNESRLLQHISRSIFSRGTHKHVDRFQLECDADTGVQSKPKKTTRMAIPGLRRIEDGALSHQKCGQPKDTDAIACLPETGRPSSAAAAGAASASSSFVGIVGNWRRHPAANAATCLLAD
ncbi:unnamed protein product [Peronospora destructor]|uniref:Uncharacterized protein n=1 Tax=Peronospora destructor TaxID=86335 RepID=A0AAV0T7C0_9STRA|nr:unnamed protein product [Peronospora destructor]